MTQAEWSDYFQCMIDTKFPRYKWPCSPLPPFTPEYVPQNWTYDLAASPDIFVEAQRSFLDQMRNATYTDVTPLDVAINLPITPSAPSKRTRGGRAHDNRIYYATGVRYVQSSRWTPVLHRPIFTILALFADTDDINMRYFQNRYARAWCACISSHYDHKLSLEVYWIYLWRWWNLQLKALIFLKRILVIIFILFFGMIRF